MKIEDEYGSLLIQVGLILMLRAHMIYIHIYVYIPTLLLIYIPSTNITVVRRLFSIQYCIRCYPFTYPFTNIYHLSMYPSVIYLISFT
jgi:hypothetical protein